MSGDWNGDPQGPRVAERGDAGQTGQTPSIKMKEFWGSSVPHGDHS